LGGRFDLATVDFFAIVMVYPFNPGLRFCWFPFRAYQKKGAL
jgi:hypothetical protein